MVEAAVGYAKHLEARQTAEASEAEDEEELRPLRSTYDALISREKSLKARQAELIGQQKFRKTTLRAPAHEVSRDRLPFLRAAAV